MKRERERERERAAEIKWTMRVRGGQAIENENTHLCSPVITLQSSGLAVITLQSSGLGWLSPLQ